jgi:competence protein ComEC
MRKPLVPFLVAMMAGIVLGNVIHIPNPPLMVCLLFTFVLLLPASLKKWKNVTTLLLMLAFLISGVLHINLYLHQDRSSNHIIHHITGEIIIVEGVISENPEVSSDKTEITVSAARIISDDANILVEGLVLLTLKDPQLYKYGDYVRFKAKLKAPHNFRNPGGFDYEQHLRYRGILVRGFISDPAGIVVLRENQGNVLKTHLERFRGSLKKLIRDNSLSPDGEIIQAMILGDQKEIPKEVMDNFNKTGTSHIIAISGFNIGIVAVLSMIVIRMIMKSSSYLLLRFNMNVVSTVFAIVPVVIYTFIAGMGMSVVRATIMAITFMIAILLGRERSLYNTLALAAFIILVIYPHALFDISFQLSFVAVWSILFITPRLMERLPKGNHETASQYLIFNRKTLKNILIFVMVSVSATLGTLPLIVYYFNRVSTVVLLSNLAVVPVLGIIAIPVSTAIILAALISPTLGVFFVHISSFLVWISVAMVDFFASLPGSSFFISTPSLWEIVLYYGLLISVVKLMDFRNANKENEHGKQQATGEFLWYRTAVVVILIFFFADAIYLNTHDLFTENLKVTAIDVGQGSSILVQLPGGRRMLIDGGGFPEGSFDVGRYVVASYLWHERISNIDIVVLTHPHPDHLNGLVFILSNFGVKEVWTNADSSGSDAYQDFKRIISERRIQHKSVSQKTGTVRMNDVLIDIINPEEPTENTEELSQQFEEVNNRSIVMKMTFGNVSFLFPGDISESAEARLIHLGRNMKSQVLFVPHHGSFSSSTEPFIRHILPDIAIVSCGTDNIYKVPHPDVLKLYSLLGTRIFRTDKDGAVSIITNGRNIIPLVFRQSGS